MMTTQRLIGGGATLLSALLVPTVQAANYPTEMRVSVEVWNDGQQDLDMAYASWITQTSYLSDYHIAASTSGGSFSVTLSSPNEDSAVFKYASVNGKVCKFKFAHARKFSWFGLKPSPEKFATAQSVGTSEARCSASVTRGTNSLAGYGVRFRMN